METTRRVLILALLCLCPPSAGAEQLQRLPPVEAPPNPDTLPAAELESAPTADFATQASYDSASGFPIGASGLELDFKFNKGLGIRSTDMEALPFSMYLGARMQLRHTGFTRFDETWTDNAGVTRGIRNRNNFDSERMRLNISGTAISPDLDYYIIFDADSDGGSQVDGLAYIFTYEINPTLKLRLGRWKAAYSREWILSSRYIRMVDRSMATEYFRGGFTDGLWLLGDFALFDRCDGRRPWHYEACLSNGLRSSTRQPFTLDDNFALSASTYCDPLGAYGEGPTDFAWHDRPVVRAGMSCAFDKSDDRSDAGPSFALGDDNFLRLSDGTRLADVGALAPGVRLLGDRVALAAFDVGMKYRGWSLSAEYFLRSIYDLNADAPLPMNKLYDYGYHVECGRFLIPHRLDINARVSQVSGMLGDGFEYSGGFNLFWGAGPDDRINKFTFDVTRVVQSPVTSTTADMIAGDDGLLFRSQVQIAF